MTDAAVTAVDAPPAPPRTRPRVGTGALFWTSFGGLLLLLLIRNRALFTAAIDERGDFAANSIIVDRARHFELLVGNYSRLGFAHPGPAYFYVQAFGEWFAHDLLGLVPSEWNGQALAMLALAAAFLAGTLAIIRAWSASPLPAAAAGAAALAYLSFHGHVVASMWMPYAYAPAFLLLLAAAASVAAGRAGHLWALAAAGGFLVHGHAEFLFFVPLLAGAALAALWWRHRRALPITARRRDWLLFAAVIALFLLPIVVNLVVHWPGEFARYFGYGGGSGGHGADAILKYTLSFWPDPPLVGGLLLIALVAAVPLLARRNTFMRAATAFAVGATLLFAVYAAIGIDDLSQAYVGFFSLAVPLLLITLLGAAIAERLSDRPGRVSGGMAGPLLKHGPVPPLTALALVIAVVLAARSPLLVSPRDAEPTLPAAVAAVRVYAAGRPVALDLDHDAWPAMTGLVIGAERRGVRVCVRDPKWRFLVTQDYLCTPAERAQGAPATLHAGTAAPPGHVLTTLINAVLTAP